MPWKKQRDLSTSQGHSRQKIFLFVAEFMLPDFERSFSKNWNFDTNLTLCPGYFQNGESYPAEIFTITSG